MQQLRDYGEIVFTKPGKIILYSKKVHHHLPKQTPEEMGTVEENINNCLHCENPILIKDMEPYTVL